jgi:ribonuclease HI
VGEKTNWKRMRFKTNKVWVAVDGTERALLKNGKALIKYQLDQHHEYRVNPSGLQPLESEAPPKSTQPPRQQTAGLLAAAAEATDCENAVCIYTDGACSGNPGPAGIGVILTYKGQRKEISRFIGMATNNVAELEAIRVGLRAVKNRRYPVVVFTDSQYAFGLLTQGWKATRNIDLVNDIRRLALTFSNLRIVKIKGHAGHAENERADRLAVMAIGKASSH